MNKLKLIFLEKKRKKNNKILEITIRELCTQYINRRVWSKEDFTREKTWKMKIKKDVNEGKMEPIMYGKPNKSPEKGLEID